MKKIMKRNIEKLQDCQLDFNYKIIKSLLYKMNSKPNKH